MKKKNNKKKKIILFAFIVLVVIACSVVGIVIYLNKNKQTPTTNKESVILNSIEAYGITLSDMDTELYKKEYEILKKNLESDKVDMEEYAKSISKLFVIDLYTLTNKINKYDVGGHEVVYPKIRDNYILNVEDTLYKYLEDNSQDQRKQILPEVTAVTLDSIKPNKYTIKTEDTTYDGYKVKVSMKYNKSLGYDDEAELIIIKVNEKENDSDPDKIRLYIAEKN